MSFFHVGYDDTTACCCIILFVWPLLWLPRILEQRKTCGPNRSFFPYSCLPARLIWILPTPDSWSLTPNLYGSNIPCFNDDPQHSGCLTLAAIYWFLLRFEAIYELWLWSLGPSPIFTHTSKPPCSYCQRNLWPVEGRQQEERMSLFAWSFAAMMTLLAASIECGREYAGPSERL